MLIILLNFLLIHILWFLNISNASELFYILLFLLPLIELIYFYVMKKCREARYIIWMVVFNTIFFDIWLTVDNNLGLTFALINAFFSAFFAMFIMIYYMFKNECPCFVLSKKSYCTGFMLFIFILIEAIFEYIMRMYVHL